jgi:protein TonB
MSIDQNRAFHYAVLASLVLHALVLFGTSQRERPRAAAPEPPIIARLMEPPAPPSAPAAQAPQIEAVKPPPPRTKQIARKRPAKKAPAAEPQPAQREEPPVAETPELAQPAPAPPAVIGRVDPAPSAPAPASAETAPAETARPETAPVEAAAADPGSLAQYRLQLISAARNYKRYPRVAIDNNWEGDVVVRMAVGANGRLAELTIRSSSGHAVLDQQAIEMFRKAATTVQIPPALRGKEFALELRAIYNLRDQGSG